MHGRASFVEEVDGHGEALQHLKGGAVEEGHCRATGDGENLSPVLSRSHQLHVLHVTSARSAPETFHMICFVHSVGAFTNCETLGHGRCSEVPHVNSPVRRSSQDCVRVNSEDGLVDRQFLCFRMRDLGCLLQRSQVENAQNAFVPARDERLAVVRELDTLDDVLMGELVQFFARDSVPDLGGEIRRAGGCKKSFRAELCRPHCSLVTFK
mmetsp:Transcript_70206/g.120567  ORF Transcript_70206/g.120567 Transcript_70206/m.120567 type:complete len:210 (-) Transcript_70206:7-636(-)